MTHRYIAAVDRAFENFRHDAIHSRFQKQFLWRGRANLAAAAADSAAASRLATAWRLHAQVLTDASQFVRDYPTAASPCQLLNVPPLRYLPEMEQDRVREFATLAFEQATSATEVCQRLALRIAELQSECAEIDRCDDAKLRLHRQTLIWPRLTDLCVDLEALPHGVWVP